MLRKRWGLYTIPLAVGSLYVVVFLFTRLINLTEFPVYVLDEPMYVYRARETLAGDWFYSLRVSLKIIYTWLTTISFILFDNELFAVRFTSVIAGLLSAGTCSLVVYKLYARRDLALLATIFYLLLPFAIFFDRMGLSDSLLTLLTGLSLLFSIYLWKTASFKWAFLLGVILAIAMLTKSYGFLFANTPILLWLLVERKIRWRKIVQLLAVAYTIALGIVLPLLFTFSKPLEYDVTRVAFTEAAAIEYGPYTNNPVQLWLLNAALAGEWLVGYLTWPVVGLLLLSIGIAIYHRDKIVWVMAILIAQTVLFFIIFAADWYSRYLMSIVTPATVLLALGVDDIARWFFKKLPTFPVPIWQAAILGGVCIPAVLFGYTLLFQPRLTPLPPRDKQVYIERSGRALAGFSLDKVAAYIEENVAKPYPYVLLLEGVDRWPSIAIEVHMKDKNKLKFFPISSFLPETLLNENAHDVPLLAVLNYDKGEKPVIYDGVALREVTHPQLWLLASFPSPSGERFVGVYQWLPPADFAVRWLQQGGDPTPRIVGPEQYPILVADSEEFVSWKDADIQTTEGQLHFDAEYLFVTPTLVQQTPLAQFITTDGTHLEFNRLPPDWWLAYAYPNLFCEWCILQLRPPTYPLEAQYTYEETGDTFHLAGYDLSDTSVAPGEALYITLYWKGMQPMTGHYNIFVHIVDKQGQLVAQVDQPPLDGLLEQQSLPAGLNITDRHMVTLPNGITPGEYQIFVGVYETNSVHRLVLQTPHQTFQDNALVLPGLIVK